MGRAKVRVRSSDLGFGVRGRVRDKVVTMVHFATEVELLVTIKGHLRQRHKEKAKQRQRKQKQDRDNGRQ